MNPTYLSKIFIKVTIHEILNKKAKDGFNDKSYLFSKFNIIYFKI